MGVVTTQVDWLGSSKIVNINVIVDVFNIQLGPKKPHHPTGCMISYISSIVDQRGSLTSRMDDVHNDPQWMIHHHPIETTRCRTHCSEDRFRGDAIRSWRI